jgi:hypothetical protein
MSSLSIIEDLMREFAENTGLNSERDPKRYLWTDAFAVCNFIQLFKQTKNEKYKDLAIDLVDQVHSILGKHRDDDPREGWLSNNPKHPTKNGLRIGKDLPERKRDQPIDQQLEWERDGQYFHYLTKWMVTLISIGNFLEEETYKIWAADLVQASMSFVHNERMFWKMSIDLSRPLVSSMGQHDPLDGYTVFRLVDMNTEEDLSEEVNVMFKMAKGLRLETEDPLGMGNMLIDTYRLYKMNEKKEFIDIIIEAVKNGIQYFNANIHSLAFRELGLAIGIDAAKRMNRLKKYWNISEKLNTYWVNHRRWEAHKDINQVMLATSLDPNQYLEV